MLEDKKKEKFIEENYSLLSEMFALYPNVLENNFSRVIDEYLY
jgi:hypothetical protein